LNITFTGFSDRLYLAVQEFRARDNDGITFKDNDLGVTMRIADNGNVEFKKSMTVDEDLTVVGDATAKSLDLTDDLDGDDVQPGSATERGTLKISNKYNGTKTDTSVSEKALKDGLATKQPLNTHLNDVSDGEFTGSKVGSGIKANNITSGTLSDDRLSPNVSKLGSSIENNEIVSISGSKVGSGINGANITSGTVPYARTNTYGDLGNEGRLDNNHNDDLISKKQLEDKIAQQGFSTSTTYTPLPKNQSGGTVSVQEFYTKTAGLNLDGTHTHTINLGINSSVYDVVSVEITIFRNDNDGFPYDYQSSFGSHTSEIGGSYNTQWNSHPTTGVGFAYSGVNGGDTVSNRNYHLEFQHRLNARYYVDTSGSSTYVKLYIRPGGFFDSSSFNSAKIGIVSNTIKK